MTVIEKLRAAGRPREALALILMHGKLKAKKTKKVTKSH